MFLIGNCWTGNPGYITKNLLDQIYIENGIDKSFIGKVYSMYEVAEICTEAYFRR